MARGALKAASVLGALLGDEFADRPKKKVTFVSPEISGSSSTSTSEEDNNYNDDGSDSTDANSTTAEAGTDDELSNFEEYNLEPDTADETNMTTTDSSEAPEWTREEDRAVVNMKTEGKTWADIGKELDRGKREVQRRYKALSSDAEKLGLSVEKLSQVWAEEVKKKDEPKNKKDGKGKAAKGKAKEKPKKADASKDEDKKNKNKSKSKSTAPPSTPKKKAPATKQNENTKPSSQGKKKKVVIAESSSSPSSPSSSSSSSSSSEDPDTEHWRQQRYVYHEVFGPLYPDQRRLRPGAGWSEDDCRTLAVLEARHRALKWMALQSDFYNATGRMVDAGVLRAKFEEVEVEGE